MKERILRALEEKKRTDKKGKWSQAELARRAGIPRVTLNKTLTGDRVLKADEAIRLANVLELDPKEIGIIHTPEMDQPRSVTYVKVTGQVAAGAWQEVNWSDFDPYEIPVAIDPRWPPEAISGLEVRGESINRQARNGSHVVVLDAYYAPRTFREGDWVVVRRHRGETVETTVKLVRGSERTGWELWPDSDDPRHATPIKLAEPGTDTIDVVGFVVEFVKPGTRF